MILPWCNLQAAAVKETLFTVKEISIEVNRSPWIMGMAIILAIPKFVADACESE